MAMYELSPFLTADDESLQEKFDTGWYSDSTPYQPERKAYLTAEQMEKIGREVLYRTTGIHEEPHPSVA